MVEKSRRERQQINWNQGIKAINRKLLKEPQFIPRQVDKVCICGLLPGLT